MLIRILVSLAGVALSSYGVYHIVQSGQLVGNINCFWATTGAIIILLAMFAKVRKNT